ncbi:MAG: nucleotide exchange factor GrpE [Cyclobacteriaceae bacterium]|jgi:molecular chaperone GrpE|nr:nucleotide exchange factor GrpE [Cyclobacteriaceae bacterium]
MMNANSGEEKANQEEIVSENHQEMPNNENEEVRPQEAATDVSADQQAAANEELLEMKDKYLRLYSEFENFRRRTSREKLDMIQTANEQVITSLLPVLDDFERAEKAVGDAGTELTDGFILIGSKFRKILDQFGLKSMEITAGSEFDADYQEAVSQVPTEDENLKGKVVDVVEQGYLLNDKVIRYAKVVVGN